MQTDKAEAKQKQKNKNTKAAHSKKSSVLCVKKYMKYL